MRCMTATASATLGYQLYRRYCTGKPVTFTEENGQLRVLMDGRVLAKLYQHPNVRS